VPKKDKGIDWLQMEHGILSVLARSKHISNLLQANNILFMKINQ